jgi:hypothetical protein
MGYQHTRVENRPGISQRLAMVLDDACKAIVFRRRVEVNYGGFSRVVEIHACGTNQEGVPVMRIWQVRGEHRSNEVTGWKLLTLGSVTSYQILDEPSGAPRPTYFRGDPAIAHIAGQV